MDKYEEAIEAIKSNYPPDNYTILREGLDLAIEVLEKQIPRQVGDIIGDYENDYDCPICGTITRFEHQRHCIECGQKLKW